MAFQKLSGPRKCNLSGGTNSCTVRCMALKAEKRIKTQCDTLNARICRHAHVYVQRVHIAMLLRLHRTENKYSSNSKCSMQICSSNTAYLRGHGASVALSPSSSADTTMAEALPQAESLSPSSQVLLESVSISATDHASSMLMTFSKSSEL